MKNILLTLGLVVCACRSSSNSNTDASKTGDSGGNGDSLPTTTVKAIRMNQPTNEAVVNLANVVVIGSVSSSKYGHIWVQDAGGGEYSGIQVFCNYAGTTPSCALTRAEIDALVPGTVVNVSGMFDSYAPTSPAGAQPNLEIDSPTITMTGQTMTPMTVDVAASVIAKDQQASAAALPYKGAYVHVTGASTYTVGTITLPPVATGTPTEFANTCTGMPTGTPPVAGSGYTYDGVELTGGSTTLAVAFTFYSSFDGCTPCSATMPYACAAPTVGTVGEVTAGETFTDLKGVVEPEYVTTPAAVFLQISPVTDTDMPHS